MNNPASPGLESRRAQPPSGQSDVNLDVSVQDSITEPAKSSPSRTRTIPLLTDDSDSAQHVEEVLIARSAWTVPHRTEYAALGTGCGEGERKDRSNSIRVIPPGLVGERLLKKQVVKVCREQCS